MQGWLSILIMIALGAGFALISILLSGLLGPQKPTLLLFGYISVWPKGALDCCRREQ